MWNWIKKRLAPKLWQLEIEARVEANEAHISDLRDRFTRFQNRENMRAARSALHGDQELASAVDAALGRSDNGATDVPRSEGVQSKLDLYSKLQRRH